MQYKKKQAKSDYLTTKVEDFKNQPKKLWSTLKSLGTSSQPKTKPGSFALNVDNKTIFAKNEVAEHFDKVFTTVASSLVNKLPHSQGKYGSDHVRKYYSTVLSSNDGFNLGKVTEDKVLKILCNLNSSKATGLDQLSTRFVKDGSKLIVSPLTHIVNLSLANGNIPSDLKSARVTPIHKKK